MTLENIELMLINYNNILLKINIIKKELSSIEELGCSAINFNSDGDNICQNFSETKKNDKYKLKLEKIINVLEVKINIIDKSLEVLDPMQGEIIKAKFFENKSYYKISNDLHISERYIRKIKAKAINQIYKLFDFN